MAVSASVNIGTPLGFDMFALFQDMAEGLYSTSGAGTEFVSFSYDDMLMTFTGGFVDDTFSVSGLTVTNAEGDSLYSTSSAGTDIFSTSAAGTELADLPQLFAASYSSDLQIRFSGGRGDDIGLGTNNNDRMSGRDGDDMLFGRGGNDRIDGGKGDDLVSGGAGDDRISGGRGNDLLISGPGDDVLNGGAGNDVLVMGFMSTGSANPTVLRFDATGGAGSDVFVIDAFQSTGSGNPTVLRAQVRDFDDDDLLVISGVAQMDAALPTLAGGTLADVTNGMIDEFQWRDTKRGVEIQVEDTQILLRGVTAGDVDLDRFLFTDQNNADVTDLFFADSGGGQLGSGMDGDAFITFGAETTTFIAFGAEGTTFITFGAEGSTFDDLSF